MMVSFTDLIYILKEDASVPENAFKYKILQQYYVNFLLAREIAKEMKMLFRITNTRR